MLKICDKKYDLLVPWSDITINNITELTKKHLQKLQNKYLVALSQTLNTVDK